MVTRTRALVAVVKPARRIPRILADVLSIAAILLIAVVGLGLASGTCAASATVMVDSKIPEMKLVATADEGRVLIFEDASRCVVAVTRVYGGRTVSLACRP